jgi:hypothetical protein
MKTFIIWTLIIGSFIAYANYESPEEKQARLAKIEQLRIEREKRKREEELRRKEEEKQRKIREAREAERRAIEEAKRRRQREIYNKYINNSLYTGATPYSYCYGTNKSCNSYGCSQIKVRTPSNSDVLVTIKKDGNVVRHAYIKAGSSHTFEVPNGRYQPFFYYGKGWNPNKVMKKTSCGTIRGGFISNESFGKDDPQYLSNNILTYELILQQNGNFSTRPSNENEAF